jgi:hypothetical protein
MQTIFDLRIFSVLRDGLDIESVEMKLDAGVLFQEPGYPTGDNFHREEGPSPHAENLCSIVLTNQGGYYADFIEGAAADFGQQSALCGNGHTARPPNKQLAAQSLFQKLDLMADSALTDRKLFRCSGEALAMRNSFEGP